MARLLFQIQIGLTSKRCQLFEGETWLQQGWIGAQVKRGPTTEP